MTKRKSGVDEEMEWAGGQEEDKISQLHFGACGEQPDSRGDRTSLLGVLEGHLCNYTRDDI